MTSLAFIGFMGSGKSTAARRAAAALGCEGADADIELERAFGKPIERVFDEDGEAVFRAREEELTLELLARAPVVALGGGSFAQPANFDVLQDNGVTVWLDCPFDVVKRRVTGQSQRPLAREPVEFERLYETRLGDYRRAHYRIVSDSDDPDVAVQAILKLPIF